MPRIHVPFAAALVRVAAVIAVVLASLACASLAGLRLDGASAAWQWVIIAAALIVIGVFLKVLTPALWRARVGQFQGRSAGGFQWEMVFIVSAVLGLILLWHQPRSKIPSPTGEPVTVVRLDDPVAVGEFPRQGFWLSGNASTLAELPLPRGLTERPAPGGQGRLWIPDTNAAMPDPLRLEYKTARWPIPLPRHFLDQQDLPADRFLTIQKVVGTEGGSDADGFPVAGSVLKKKPIPFFDPPEFAGPGVPKVRRTGAAGAKVLLPATVELTGQRDLIHYWVGLPTDVAQQSMSPCAPPAEAYALVVDAVGSSESRYPLYPIYAVGWQRGVPVFYLCPIKELPGQNMRSGFDTCGDSGQEHPGAVLSGAVRVWRSSAAAAPGACCFMPGTADRKSAGWIDGFRERYLPASRVQEEPRQLSVPRILAAVLTTLLLLACAVRSLRKVR
jgi:hypothetical protein